jgi:uncharacterized membrane protein YuzA (DUF378 family)
MKALNLVTLILVIIGGLNWGIFGLSGFDVVGTIFGGSTSVLSRIVFVIVGLSALWQIVPLAKAFNAGEITAESSRV